MIFLRPLGESFYLEHQVPEQIMSFFFLLIQTLIILMHIQTCFVPRIFLHKLLLIFADAYLITYAVYNRFVVFPCEALEWIFLHFFLCFFSFYVKFELDLVFKGYVLSILNFSLVFPCSWLQLLVIQYGAFVPIFDELRLTLLILLVLRPIDLIFALILVALHLVVH